MKGDLRTEVTADGEDVIVTVYVEGYRQLDYCGAERRLTPRRYAKRIMGVGRSEEKLDRITRRVILRLERKAKRWLKSDDWELRQERAASVADRIKKDIKDIKESTS